jgi:outer membrane protein TolC
MRFYFFCLFAGSISISAVNPLSLEQAIKITLKQNPVLCSMKHYSEAEVYSVEASKKDKFGSLDANISLQKNSDDGLIQPMNRELMTGGIPQMPFDSDSAMWNLNYTLPLYTAGRLSILEHIAREQQESIHFKQARLVWDLKYRVTKTYLNLISAEKQRDALEAHLDSLRGLKKHIEQSVSAGKLADIDLLKVDYQVAASQSKLANVVQIHASLYTALMNLMGIKDECSYDLTSAMPDAVEMISSKIPELVRNALENRSDIKALSAAARIKTMNVSVAKADRLPEVYLNTRLTGVYGATLGYNDQFWSVQANATYNLFDKGKRKARIQRARSREQAAFAEIEVKELQIRQEVTDAFRILEREYQNYQTAQYALDLQKEIERIELLKYENGKGNIDDYLLAKSRLDLSLTGLIQQKSNFFIAKAGLQRSIEGVIK